MPTEGAPAETAANAYSIWTNFPDGLSSKENNKLMLQSFFASRRAAGDQRIGGVCASHVRK